MRRGRNTFIPATETALEPGDLVVAAITLVLGTGDYTLKFGAFTLGGIGTATFGAILLWALLGRGGAACRQAVGSPVLHANGNGNTVFDAIARVETSLCDQRRHGPRPV